MAKKKRSKILETKYFGLILGVLILSVMFFARANTTLSKDLELKMLDLHFYFRQVSSTQTLQEGVKINERNYNISPDILLVGIDFKSLNKFGKWPFPRYREANLLDRLARIKQQNERESSVFLDIFFIEPDSSSAYNDAILINSIKDNGRVFLETVLEYTPPPSDSSDEFFDRQQVLYNKVGEFKNIQGDINELVTYYGLQPPLKPYSAETYSYGHANFVEDNDKIYRRQSLIARSSRLVEILRLDNLTKDLTLNEERFERIAWIDKDNIVHPIEYPLTDNIISKLKTDMESSAPQKAEDSDKDGKPDDYYYIVRKYEDHFIPSITFALALNYFHKSFDEIEIILGKHIHISNPKIYDVETQTLKQYSVQISPDEIDAETNEIISPGERKILSEINIPIDIYGQMLINFMGPRSSASTDGYKTYPVRSFSGYASSVPGTNPASWRKTNKLGNKIVMVGPFAKGMAEDEKTTPFGLMYGVEIHANALNTIIMDKFIHPVPDYVNYLILAFAVMLASFMSSRLSTILSLILSVLLVICLFLGISLNFDWNSVFIEFAFPAIGVFITFLTIVVYRVMTEEKDKKRIKNMFGKFVPPAVVEEMISNPPELGGIDRDLTVLFSDIRSFTTLSESMTPQDLVNHLNKYLTVMTDCIMEYGGTLDKYVGDEIMCFWGAPLPQEDHAVRSCKCALRQMELLHGLNETWPPERRLNIGIGLNSGEMTVGNMGSEGRMNYTLMGDNVNLGARLEGTNKQYGSNIIISELTYLRVKDSGVIVRELDNIRVKGKLKPVLIFELIGFEDGIEPEDL